MILVEPAVRQKLEVPKPTFKEPAFEEPAIRPRADIPREMEKPDWAQDILKTIAQMQMQMKEKGIDTPLDYTDLDLYKSNDPLPKKFKFSDTKKYTGTEDPHLHLKQYMTYLSTT